MHQLRASPGTVHWGFYDARLNPVLKIRSGDTVSVETVSGNRESFSPADLNLLYHEIPQLREIHNKVRDKGPGPHILTGPIAIADAEPGDVLAITLMKVLPNASFGFNLIIPNWGTLPEEFPYMRTKIIRYDPRRRYALFSSSVRIPVQPFFGHLGVAPPPTLGRVTSVIPGIHGGNLDNKELTSGSVLYLPIHVDDALFSVGDGHAVQGDGEVCLTALETGMRGLLRLEVRKDMSLKWPMAETKTHFISMGFHADLDEASRIALRNALDFLISRKGLSPDDAYALCSMAVDLRITQLVNSLKGVHAMLPKSIFSQRS